MKKLILIVLFLFCQNLANGQTDTLCGIIPTKNGIATYTGVISIENRSANQIYTSAKLWITKTFAKPKEVIISDVESSLIVLKVAIKDPDIPSSRYLFDFILQFKDDKCRYELSNISFHLPSVGIENKLESTPAFKEKLAIHLQRIDNIINTYINNFKQSITVTEDW